MWPNPQETVDLVTFTEEILNGKLYCFYNDAVIVAMTHIVQNSFYAFKTQLEVQDKLYL